VETGWHAPRAPYLGVVLATRRRKHSRKVKKDGQDIPPHFPQVHKGSGLLGCATLHASMPDRHIEVAADTYFAAGKNPKL